jgi:hypothetical protein
MGPKASNPALVFTCTVNHSGATAGVKQRFPKKSGGAKTAPADGNQGIEFTPSKPRFCRNKLYDILKGRAYIPDVRLKGQWYAAGA